LATGTETLVSPRTIVTLAALLGAGAVAIGAFAAHALAGDPRAAGLLETAARYQMWHALALLALGTARLAAPLAAFAWLVGTALFCGALGALALGAPGWIATAAPFGGAAFIAGWLALALAAWRRLR
jgi:uncharacterized membrane protein YgdD (TMEM256/DUF423 family)